MHGALHNGIAVGGGVFRFVVRLEKILVHAELRTKKLFGGFKLPYRLVRLLLRHAFVIDAPHMNQQPHVSAFRQEAVVINETEDTHMLGERPGFVVILKEFFDVKHGSTGRP